MAAENKPEGLKKIRNPDRMYRSAVCYSAHAPPKSVSDDTETNNEHGHLKIYLPKKLLECLPKCSTLPKERHRWNTNEEEVAYFPCCACKGFSLTGHILSVLGNS
ncbi:calmodulin-binding transcription activator 1-like, partial [Sinocyclocheilus rhinocerous]|uniref:calmodulin-binding transcription activator 1-like n=1 Tax=Sinocyclocheilus rhinocerous TaxID=307959 RepID=UPI0007B8A44F